MIPARFSEVIDNGMIKCRLCQRKCKIPPGRTGYCKTRKNLDGVLYSLIYGRVSSIRVSPIEIKPLFHFYPGSHWLSLGSLGCNFLCPGCQNWELAHADVEKEVEHLPFIEPKKLIQLALEGGCKGISWTYNEPTLWLEYTLDCAKEARKCGLLTNYVTNAFITIEALDLIGPYVNAYRADLKGFSNKTYRKIAQVKKFDGILSVLKRARHYWNMHVEIVTNLIPGINDKEMELKEMAEWICAELGPETPWHITRFVPHFKWTHLKTTPVLSLENTREIGLEAGLKYVYIGNIPDHPAENTYCPICGNLIICRANYKVVKCDLHQNRCIYCNTPIAGVF